MKFICCGLLLVCMQCFAGIPPVDNRPARAVYISQFLKEGDVGIEIGVDQGAFSYNVLLKKAPAKLYLVDPWVYLPAPDSGIDLSTNNPRPRDHLYGIVCSTFEPFENVEIIRMRSEEAAHLFEDDSVDYVYIGLDPSSKEPARYETVTRDLENYFPKIKEGGYILGDGFTWRGVNPAVVEFLERHSGECEFVNDPIYGNSAAQYVIRKTAKSWWRFW